MNEQQIDYHDLQDLAIEVTGIDEDSDIDAIEQALYEKFGVCNDEFYKIAEALLALTVPVKGAIGDYFYKGFAKNGVFICKTRCNHYHQNHSPGL